MSTTLDLHLCRKLAPDCCPRSAADAAAQCVKLWPTIKKSFPHSIPLSDCKFNASAPRKTLLDRFSFTEHPEGKKTLARGLYILFEGTEAKEENAFYVGIANDVPKRLVNHLTGTSHHTASLPYLLMHRHLPAEALITTALDRNGEPKKKMRADLFKEHRLTCDSIRTHLQEKCRVVIFPVPDIITLHFLEAFVAVELKTGPWNSFRPH